MKTVKSEYRTNIPTDILLESSEQIKKAFKVEVLDLDWFRFNPNSFLTVDPDIKGGALVFKSSRLTAKAVASRLEHGDSLEDIKEDYPNLTDLAIAQAVCAAALEL